MGLHYAVWESSPDMRSTFVTLATLTAPSCAQSQLILNLAEMWMCLVFQTLTSLHLDSWLSDQATAMWSGNHLNVALPLWQGFTNTQENRAIADAIGGRVTFQQYLASQDPVIRTWAQHARGAFNDIRNSPDPGIRNYWWELHKERVVKAQESWGAKKAEMAKQHLKGAKVSVLLYPGNHGDHQIQVSSGSFSFTISRSLGLHLRHGDEVILQYHLTSTSHPHPYVTSALKTDPASRLGVSIRGQDDQGSFHCWLNATGECNARKMNSLVDLLEGYPLKESQGFKRRWFVCKSSKQTGDSRPGRNRYT